MTITVKQNTVHNSAHVVDHVERPRGKLTWKLGSCHSREIANLCGQWMSTLLLADHCLSLAIIHSDLSVPVTWLHTGLCTLNCLQRIVWRLITHLQCVIV